MSENLVAVLGLIVSAISALLALLAFFGVQQVRLSQRRADARRLMAVWGPIDSEGTCGVKVVNQSNADFRGLVTVACGVPVNGVARLHSVLFEPKKEWTSGAKKIHQLIDHNLGQIPGVDASRPPNHDGDVHRVHVTYSDGRRYWVRREQTVERLDKLVIWAERTRAGTISGYLGRNSPFLRQTKIRVKVVPFARTEDLEEAVRQLAATGGTDDGADLPDIVVGPHDWIGGVATSDWVEPLPPLLWDEQSRFHPATVAALRHNGRLIAAPYVFDTVALIRNDRLAGSGPMPGTLAEVIASGQQAVASQRIADGLALALQVGPPNSRGEAGDPYHIWPLFSSAGGSFFGLRRPEAHDAPDGGRDVFDDREVWRNDFIEAFGSLATLGRGPGGMGVLDPRIGRAEAIKAFVEQRAPYLVCSSRALKSIRKKGADITVAAVPQFGPRPAVPMVSVYGFFLYRHAPNMTAATDVLFQYLANATAGVDLQRFQPLVPVQRRAMDRVRELNPQLKAYVEQSRHGMIMPSYPEMREAWKLMGMAEYQVLAGEGRPEAIAATAADTGWELLRAARES